VFLSNYFTDDVVLAAVSEGAAGFVAKPRMQLDLVDAIEHARSGRAFVPSAAVLPRWPRPARRRHDLQLYGTDASLADAAASFLDTAGGSGDSLLVIATKPHLEAVDSRLAALGVDTARLAAGGRYTRLDSHRVLEEIVTDGTLDAQRVGPLLDQVVMNTPPDAAGSPSHVTVVGELAPILCERGLVDEALALEETVDMFAATRGISVLCVYSTACLAAPDLRTRIGERHSVIVPASRTA
jgi:hypothetical protein